MRKICVITTVHKPLDVRIFQRECLSLAKRYKITIIAPEGRTEDIRNVSFILVKVKKSKLLRPFLGFKFFKEAIRKDYDAYHFHDMDFLFWAWLIRILKKKPVIYDVHEIYEMVIENRRWIPIFLKPLVVFLFNIYEGVFGSRHFHRVVAAPHQLDRYPGATLLMNFPPKENFLKPIFPKDYKKITYIGSITKGRVLGRVFEIADILPERYVINLFGENHDSQESQNKKINFLGFVDNNELQTRVADTGVGIIPFIENDQFKKSVPSKIFDYMGLGLNIIAPSFIKESFGNLAISNNISFVGGDAKSFVEEIIRISSSPEEAKNKSTKNYNDFLKNYCWEKEEPKLLGLYEKIIGK